MPNVVDIRWKGTTYRTIYPISKISFCKKR